MMLGEFRWRNRLPWLFLEQHAVLKRAMMALQAHDLKGKRDHQGRFESFKGYMDCDRGRPTRFRGSSVAYGRCIKPRSSAPRHQMRPFRTELATQGHVSVELLELQLEEGVPEAFEALFEGGLRGEKEPIHMSTSSF